MTIKFNKFNISDGINKSRVHYSVDNRIDNRKCVTIYAKDYENSLHILFADDYANNTDTMTDYFEKGRVVLFEDHAEYAKARAAAMRHECNQGR